MANIPKTSIRGESALLAVLLAAVSLDSRAQTITTAPLAVAPASVPVPVDHPLALIALVLGLCAAAFWLLRRMGVSMSTLRNVALGGTMLALGATVFWGDAVLAQLQMLQRQFTQAGGETLNVPVQPVEMAGTVVGFVSVEFTNASNVTLQIKGITLPTWDICFAQGIPAALPVASTPPVSAQCASGSNVGAGKTCWVDVAKLCAEAADAVTGAAPTVVMADAAAVNEGESVSGNVLGNDSDADGPLLVASFVFDGVRHLAGQSASVAGKGDFTLQANGAFTFLAAKPFPTSTIQMGYTTHTGVVGELTVTVNRAPVTSNVSLGTNQNAPVGGNIAVTDADGDLLSFSISGSPAHGTVVLNSATGSFTYTPIAGYAGSDGFSVTVSDGKGGAVVVAVMIAVTASNMAPMANDDTVSTDESTAVTIAVRSNDTDADGDALQVAGVTQGANGSVVIDAVTGNPIYTPNAGFVGSDAFTYTVSDSHGGTSSASVTVIVNAVVNGTPVAVADTLSTVINTAKTVTVATLLANDTDPDNDALTITGVNNPSHGTVSITGNAVTFTPDANFEGAASFQYSISDGKGGTAIGTVTVHVDSGSATAPSLVVMRSLVANAHGTGGVSVAFPIITRLVDTDGSETLTAKVSNVPTGLTFNAGTNLGGGVWQFTQADLPNLKLNLPGSYTTLATHLTVQVTATETVTGVTAFVSNVVTLKAAYTTLDVTTTTSGSYTGNSASEHIQGGSGDNVINAGSGNNIVNGDAGNDTLTAGTGSDVINGGAGNDVINGGSGADVIIGGLGNDTLKGGDAGESFVDVFVWQLGDQGTAGSPAVDTIQNFNVTAAGSNTAGGDVLDLRQLLQGESVGPLNSAGNLADYLHFEVSGGNTILHISHTGGFGADSHNVGASYTNSAETQQILLTSVNLQSLYSGATTDQQIITQLLNNNKLIVD
ncbi:midcut-by-XrtH protein [Diaphorobacter sp. HDW4A]|uniref:midcut-by-XrtH protein n=1 Tax=Diaphorobacter sp. HDW4A TaxID=2714924 RepID=UPI00140C14C6|nr:midcut-by-XrtH protein [Diaphorobacter sp. HDW4A]QIL82711.1 midcut-by-XrtH protein [Diaphorobacter sp. HDW4A]